MSEKNEYVAIPQKKKYVLVAPDGGWGYLVVVAFITYILITNIPNDAFGLLYGDFLASIGDETTGTALSNGMFFTAQSCSGFVTDLLLRKYSCQKVGFIGAFIYSSGAFLLIFVQNLPHMLICFSIMQGTGCGIMMAPMLTTFNSYFTKKMNLMMGIAQSMLVLGVMLSPYVAEITIKNIGFRYTLCVLAALALLTFAAASVLVPVERHMKRVYKDDQSDGDEKDTMNDRLTDDEVSFVPETKLTGLEAIIQTSISNIGESTPSTITLNKDKTPGLLDFRLLKDCRFLAVNVGLATTFCSDVSFIALIPVLLGDINFSNKDIAFMMTVFFGCDLGTRILYSVINAFYRIKSRYIYLIGTVLSALMRIVFNVNDSSVWRLTTLAILGCLRCFIQTTLLLVISEEYKDYLSLAFASTMIISGVVNLSFSLLASLVKYATKNNVYVLHLLTLAYLICIILWTIELIYTKREKTKLCKHKVDNA